MMGKSLATFISHTYTNTNSCACALFLMGPSKVEERSLFCAAISSTQQAHTHTFVGVVFGGNANSIEEGNDYDGRMVVVVVVLFFCFDGFFFSF